MSSSAFAETKIHSSRSSPARRAPSSSKQQIAEFEQANPGVKVDLVSLPWGQAFEKFLNMVQAGETPDIVEMPNAGWPLRQQRPARGPRALSRQVEGRSDARRRAPSSSARSSTTRYMVPYGYYLRAMFWNKKLFREAGLSDAAEDHRRVHGRGREDLGAPRQVRLLPARRTGGFNGVPDVHEFMNGKGGYFNADGTSTFNEPGSVKGLQMLADIYQKGYAPKDSVNWGFNEIVAASIPAPAPCSTRIPMRSSASQTR